ncbi:PilZ domain-containing protein [Methylobacterium sp. A54F]
MSAEHRNEVRQRVFLKGRILFNNGNSSLDCLVRDLSATGARIEASETTTLPEQFDLYIPQKDRTFRSKLRWRREDGIGITFVDDARAEAAAQPSAADASVAVLLRRINELEAENAALRRLLATLAQPAAQPAA